MDKKFDPSGVNAILAKVKEGCSETATYATSRLKSIFQSRIASQPRPDGLQQLIIEIVRRCPEISEKELWRELKAQEGQGIIQTIADDDTISFKSSPDGKMKKASGSGLKDRLTNAKNFAKNNSL